MRNKKHLIPVFFMALCAVLLMSVSVSAAPKYRNKWVREKGYNYHYNDKGKKDKGLIELKGKTYYLDSKRIQRTGWQKIDGNYYFFQIRNGSNGYMVTSSTVNGIKLSKSGKAVYDSNGLRKLNVMIKANQIMQSLTNYDMKKAEKLKICFLETMSYRSRNIGSFQKYNSTWDVYYAERMFRDKQGDCYCFGAAFAYLANAIGYTNVCAVSSGGHGWAEVSNEFYDPNWAKVGAGGKWAYFAVPHSLSGCGGRPNYKPNRVYVKKI